MLDNASIHKTDEVMELIQKANHKALFNAPWSCEQNPIEYVFGLWKRRVTIPANLTRLDEVLPILDQSFSTITRAQVARYVQFVETRIHHLAWNMEPLDLDQAMTELGIEEQEEVNEQAVVPYGLDADLD